MTTDPAPATDPTPPGSLALHDLALHDLHLVLIGVRLPVPVLGGPAAWSGGGPAGDDGTSSVDRVGVPAGADQAAAPGDRLLLSDVEGTPVAELRVCSRDEGSTVADHEPAVVLSGPLSPTRQPRWPDFDALRRSPRDLEPQHRGGTATVLRRPLLDDDVRQLAERAAVSPPLVLVPAAGPTPDGVPYALVLRDAVRRLTPLGVTVVALPLAWRDPDSDAVLATAIAQAYGADDATVASEQDAGWRAVMAALDTTTDRPAAGVADETWTELRRWRPPLAHRGVAVMLTGLSGSGKSTLALALAEHVRQHQLRTVTLLDGDVVRRLLSSGLGFDRRSRETNVRRLGWVAAEIARHGGMTVLAAIAPYQQTRLEVRDLVRAHGDFVMVHVSTPLAECERRDRKGLYGRARRGELSGMTGVDHPYEDPTDADLTIDTTGRTVDDSLGLLLRHLEAGGWLPPEAVDRP